VSDCGVCVYWDDSVSVDFFHKRVRKAVKEHKCCECDKVIAKGERYEYASGKCEGEMWQAKTCLICAEIADAFSCDGRMYGGEFWSQFSELFGELNTSCFDKLTTVAAKTELQRRYIEWQAWYYGTGR